MKSPDGNGAWYKKCTRAIKAPNKSLSQTCPHKLDQHRIAAATVHTISLPSKVTGFTLLLFSDSWLIKQTKSL